MEANHIKDLNTSMYSIVSMLNQALIFLLNPIPIFPLEGALNYSCAGVVFVLLVGPPLLEL